jgi:hypothetical protein
VPAPDSEALTVLPPEGAEHPAHALKRMGGRIPDKTWTYRTAEGAISHYAATKTNLTRVGSGDCSGRDEAGVRRLLL